MALDPNRSEAEAPSEWMPADTSFGRLIAGPPGIGPILDMSASGETIYVSRCAAVLPPRIDHWRLAGDEWVLCEVGHG